jgi:hypothetical protein
LVDNQNPICPFCKNTKNKEVSLTEKHDLLVCSECNSSIMLSSKNPLPRYQEYWKLNSEALYPRIRDPLTQHDFANPRLFFLYEDCFHCLLTGRFNAAIILLGVLLEALMRELITLKNDDYSPGSYGACLNTIESQNLMKYEDTAFLKNFKEKIRNLYQHSKEGQILKGKYGKIWAFSFDGDLTPDKLLKAKESVSSGTAKPSIIPVSSYPSIGSIFKQEYDRELAITLFNEVHDFVQAAIFKYFKQEFYDEHHKKFGNRLQDLPHYVIE